MFCELGNAPNTVLHQGRSKSQRWRRRAETKQVRVSNSPTREGGQTRFTRFKELLEKWNASENDARTRRNWAQIYDIKSWKLYHIYIKVTGPGVNCCRLFSVFDLNHRVATRVEFASQNEGEKVENLTQRLWRSSTFFLHACVLKLHEEQRPSQNMFMWKMKLLSAQEINSGNHHAAWLQLKAVRLWVQANSLRQYWSEM